ncbi:MAG: gfo/Idh/MocA family oxidoreductase [Planctomycetaceae bacterium]|nr:MAG: gfo/Idh/MocA family oxidoreductase [Planctomycetaceae bacterium]
MTERSPAVRKVLIVGTGAIAGAHAAAFQSPTVRNRATIVGAVDVDRSRVEAFCRDHGIARGFIDLDVALAELSPDLVHLCTPPNMHTDQSIAALTAGSWVLCEKPPCASLAELDQIQLTEQTTGRYCASVFQWRFGSGMQRLKHMMSSGALGKPLVAVCNTLWYRDEQYYAVPWRGKWATEIGGPTVGHGIHLMDSLLYLLGDWEEVTAQMATLDRPIEVEDVSTAMVRFRSGAMASIVNSVLCPRQETYLRIDYQNATVEARGLYEVSNSDWRWSAKPGVPGDPWDPPVTEVPASHATVVEALLGDMDAGRAPLTSGNETRRTIEFLAAMYKSAQTRQPVQAGSIDRSDPFYHAFSITPAALGNHYRSSGGN